MSQGVFNAAAISSLDHSGMRIKSITNWAYGLTVIFTGLSGAAFLMAAQASEGERVAVAQHLRFDVLAEDLVVASQTLTTEVRLYAMRKDPRHLAALEAAGGKARMREQALNIARSAGASPEELAAIAEAEQDLVDLTRLEGVALRASQAGDDDGARGILFGPDHERAENGVISSLNSFRTLTATRTSAEMRRAREVSDAAGAVAKVMLASTALLFLAVLYFVLRRRVAVPLSRMTGIVMRLARQDYAVEVPDDRRRDEIGDMTQAIQVFRENGLERERLEAERRADQRAKDNILQMMHRLQSCHSLDELGEVVACFAPQVLPDLAGSLYVMETRQSALVLVSSWLEPAHSHQSLAPTACWGVRRGRPHISNGEHRDICCPHVDDPYVLSLCVPLSAQGEAIGLLYFEERSAQSADSASRRYLDLLADNIALAVANMRLRERLADLAIRDGLTGLLNRRSLDEALDRANGGAALGCVMIDIDHFKRFNDEFGHDAGDAVMQHVAQLMEETLGDAGRAYRFGGEEFTMLLPGCEEAAVFALAERLRQRIAQAPLAHHGRLLGHVTISLGVAISPLDGPATTLLKRADAALLSAKSAGRNVTITASRLAA
jgi:diguanylate cyclase (GGDEF)-like protein